MMLRILKGLGIVVAVLVGLIVVLVITLNLMSASRQQKTYALAIPDVESSTDSAAVARGRHLAQHVSLCANCHGADLGGQALIESPVMGVLAAPNLTAGKGGIGGEYTTADFVRSIRHGVGRDNKSLVFMPSEAFQVLSDDDLGAIIAYIRSVPPVDRSFPKPKPGPLARVLHLLVGFPLLPAERVDHAAAHPAQVEGVTLEYGKYLGSVGGCTGCHGPALAGGGGPGPNITRGVIGAWSESDFSNALRHGKRPDGTTLSSEMPWKEFAGMNDAEVGALWLFQQSLPPKTPKR